MMYLSHIQVSRIGTGINCISLAYHFTYLWFHVTFPQAILLVNILGASSCKYIHKFHKNSKTKVLVWKCICCRHKNHLICVPFYCVEIPKFRTYHLMLTWERLINHPDMLQWSLHQMSLQWLLLWFKYLFQMLQWCQMNKKLIKQLNIFYPPVNSWMLHWR